jgi:metal-sulfur cluster biosynthetic enzyme
MAVTEEQVFDLLKTCYDPEIPVNIVDLGLVRKLTIQGDGSVDMDMTLTAPFCPMAGEIHAEVTEKLTDLTGQPARVQMVYDPPWTPDDLTEAGRAELGYW